MVYVQLQVNTEMSLACLAHVNFFAAHLLFDVITEQINDDDDDDDDDDDGSTVRLVVYVVLNVWQIIRR